MNPFKAAIGARRAQIGLWQALASPYTAEICAGSGFDWLLIDAEHAPNDIPLVLAQLQATAAYPVEPMVRIPSADAVLIKQYLDIGARSLMVPMVETAEMATGIVRATRYPPHGIRGVGSAIGRASRWNRRAGYLQKASEEICVVVQLETVAAIENLHAIAQVEGVDGIFLGPSDLAADMGYLGNAQHCDVQMLIDNALAELNELGVPAGILMADEALAKRYLELGVSFIAVGTDISLLARGAEQLCARFRSMNGES